MYDINEKYFAYGMLDYYSNKFSGYFNDNPLIFAHFGGGARINDNLVWKVQFTNISVDAALVKMSQSQFQTGISVQF